MPNNPRTLLLIPSVAKRGVEQDVQANQHPTMDYYALQSRLSADLADYSTMEADTHPFVKAARLAGRDAGLAAHGFVRARNYDVIFSNGENVSIPLGALLKVLPIGALAASKLPVADAAQVVFGGRSGRLVAVFSIISLVGILNVVVMGGPRILFGLARDGFMLRQAGQLNSAGAPGTAMIFTFIAAVALILVGSFDALFGMAGFLSIAVDAGVYISLFRLRQSEPGLSRPFTALGYPWLPVLPLVIALALLFGLIYEDFTASLYPVAMLGLCFPLYALTGRSRRKPAAAIAIERNE